MSLKKIIYLAKTPVFSLNPFVHYLQCKCTKNFWWLVRTPFYTKIIDLTQSDEDILSDFDKNTRYETLRAEKEQIVKIVQNAHETIFEEVLNKAKSYCNIINSDSNKNFRNNIFFSACLLNGEPIISHSYIINKREKRCRLLHSITLAENIEDKSIRAIYGRNNRYLHYSDILYFKELGFHTYDLGGYAKDTNDKKLLGINKFKDGFGGKLIEESNYDHIFLTFAKKILSIHK